MLLVTCFCCSGCAALDIPTLMSSVTGGGGVQQLQTMTSVQLTTQNYKIIKTNVVGSDWGIKLLGIFPIVSPSYVKTIKQLYKAGDVTEGKPQAIVNIFQQETSPYFILFSIPTITIRADVIEFMKPTP